jgi:hypothetical protein
MAIRPDWLNGVAAHANNLHQLEGVSGQLLFGVFVKVAQDIGLAFAAGARTGAAQIFKLDETFTAIGPFDGQFSSNVLNVQWSHGKTLFSGDVQVHTFNSTVPAIIAFTGPAARGKTFAAALP